MQLRYIYSQFTWASVEKGTCYFFTTQILPSQKKKKTPKQICPRRFWSDKTKTKFPSFNAKCYIHPSMICTQFRERFTLRFLSAVVETFLSQKRWAWLWALWPSNVSSPPKVYWALSQPNFTFKQRPKIYYSGLQSTDGIHSGSDAKS